MRLRRVGHEPLRTACVLARECHSNRRAIIKHLIDLATNLVARPTVSIASRVTILNHKIWDDPVDGDVSIIISLGELNEVVYGKGGCFREQVNSKRTLARSHDGTRRLTDTREGALVVRVCVTRLNCADLRGKIANAVSLQQSNSPATNEWIA